MGLRGLILGGAAAMVLLTACGSSSHQTTTATTSSVVSTAPATSSAPEPAITHRLLIRTEVPTGFTAQGDPSVATSIAEWLRQGQTPAYQLQSETRRLKRIGFVAAATLNLNGAQGPGLSLVEQFRAPAGSRSELANSVSTFGEGTGKVKFLVPGIPHSAGFGGSGPGQGVNVAFADGDYYYLVGEEPNAAANRAAVIASAQKLYHRVHV